MIRLSAAIYACNQTGERILLAVCKHANHLPWLCLDLSVSRQLFCSENLYIVAAYLKTVLSVILIAVVDRIRALTKQAIQYILSHSFAHVKKKHFLSKLDNVDQVHFELGIPRCLKS